MATAPLRRSFAETSNLRRVHRAGNISRIRAEHVASSIQRSEDGGDSVPPDRGSYSAEISDDATAVHDRLTSVPKPKYVVSSTRKDFPWTNSHHIAGDLRTGVQKLKDATPAGVLLGSGKLATELDRLDLIDEYKFLVHPRISGHGPTLYQSGLPGTRRLELGLSAMFGRRFRAEFKVLPAHERAVPSTQTWP